VAAWSKSTPTVPEEPRKPHLELRLAARGCLAIATLYNAGPDSLRVLSYVEAGERHYDPFTIELTGLLESRTLHFYDDRNESGPVVIDLEPNQSQEHALDLAEWARRKANGSRPLAPGPYSMSAIYRVSMAAPVWSGELRSPTVPIVID
jgi:hypothetical protein